MATLFNATLGLAQILGNVIQSISTDSTTATLVDANFPRTPPPDDAYNLGTLFFLTGTLAGSAVVVTDWTQATKTFGFATLLSAPGTGIRYAFCDKDWPLDVLRQAVNAALQSIGGMPDVYEDASYLTVANQEKYLLPNDVYNVKRVEVAAYASAPLTYEVNHHWIEKDGYLYFDTGFEPSVDGRQIRLTYVAQPAELVNDTDPISDYVHPDLLKWEAAVHALIWKQPIQAEQIYQVIDRKLGYATQMAASMRSLHPIPNLSRDIHLSRWL